MALKDFKGIIFATVILVAVVGLSFGLWWWIGESLTKITEENANLATLQADTLQRAKVLALAGETAEAREKIGQYFVKADTLAGFIEQVEFMAKSAGVNLTISQAAAKENAFLDMYAEGTFSQLMNFAHLLESMPFHAQVVKLSLAKSPGEESKQAGTWSAAVSLVLLSFEP